MKYVVFFDSDDNNIKIKYEDGVIMDIEDLSRKELIHIINQSLCINVNNLPVGDMVQASKEYYDKLNQKDGI